MFQPDDTLFHCSNHPYSRFRIGHIRDGFESDTPSEGYWFRRYHFGWLMSFSDKLNMSTTWWYTTGKSHPVDLSQYPQVQDRDDQHVLRNMLCDSFNFSTFVAMYRSSNCVGVYAGKRAPQRRPGRPESKTISNSGHSSGISSRPSVSKSSRHSTRPTP